MNQPLLSILIPTVVGREESFNLLYAKLAYQYNGSEVEVTYLKDNKEMTIGEKRELLYQRATGVYSWQIDDDDSIADNAVELILEAIKNNPDIDCICFKELVNIDNVISHSNFSLRYGDWEGDGNKLLDDGFTYHRTPFFKTPIKTSICKSVSVKHIRFAEDHDFSQRIKPLLKKEYYIDEFIYHYIHKSSDFNERYGINK